jgi:lipid-A-disaccharide synthase-like uncharacterized protein
MTREAIWGALHVQSWTEFSWVLVGLCGQLMFTMRFVVQWLTSERQRKSVIPLAFWYFSLAGGMVLLAYALWRRDPVFVVGQGTGLLIYIRNLWLIHSEKRNLARAN